MTKPKRRWRRWLFGTLAVLFVILLVAAAWVADALIRPDRLRSLINDALAGATGGLYYVELEDIEWGLGAASVQLSGVGIRLNPEVVVARARAGTLPDMLFGLEAERIDLLGVDLWGVLRGEGFHALALEMDRPILRIGVGEWLARGAGGPPAAARTEAADAPFAGSGENQRPSAVPEQGSLPRLRIDRIALNDAALENYAIPADPNALNSVADVRMIEKLDDVDFIISGLNIDPTAPPDPGRFLFSDDLSIDVGSYSYEWPDGIHSERHGPIHLSTSEGVIAVENFSLTHRDRRQLTVNENGQLPPTYTLAMDELRLEGIEFARVLAEKRFDIEAFTMRGLQGASFTDEEAETPPASRPDVQAAQVAAPVTLERPGSLITAVFGSLPPLDVRTLSVTDTSYEQIFDRRGGEFLEEPRIRRGIYGVTIEFRGFHSQPGIEFDPQRPFLSDSVSVALERIVATPDPRYRAAIEAFRLDSAASGDIHLDEFSLETIEARPQRGDPVTAEDAVSFRTGALDLRQVDFGMLMDRLQLNIDSIRLGQPTLQVVSTRRRTSAAAEPSGAAAAPRRATAPSRAIDAIIRRLPRLTVRRLAIDDAAVTSLHDATDDGWLAEPQTQLRLVDVDLLLDNFDTDPERGYDARAPLVGRASNLSVGSAEAVLGGGTYRLQLNGLAFTAADTALRIGELSYRPIVGEDSDSRNARLTTGSVVNLDNQGLLIEGIDRIALMTEGAVRASRFALQDPAVDLYVQMAPETAPGERVVATPDRSAARHAEEAAGVTLAVDLIEIGSADYRRLGAMPDHDWGIEPTLLDSFLDVDLTVRGLRINDPARDQALALDSLTLDAQELRITPGQGPDRIRLNEAYLDTGTGTLRAGLLRFGPPTREARFAGKASGLDVSTGALSLTGLPIIGLLDAVQSGTDDAWMDVVFGSSAKIGIDAIEVELADETPISVRRLDLDVAGTADILDVGIDSDLDVTVPRLSLRGVALRAMLDTKVIGIGALEVASPRITLPPRGGEPEPAEPTAAPAATADRPVGAQPGKPLRETIERAVAGLPQLHVDRLAVTDLQATGLRPDGELAARLDSTTLEILDLDLTDAGRARRDRMLFAGDVRVQSPGYAWTAGNGDAMSIGPIDLSTARGSLQLGAFQMVPAASEEQYLARTDVAEGDRVEMRFGAVGLSDIDWNALMDRGALHVGGGHIRDFTVRVLADKKKPKRPPRTKPPGMPHDVFRNLAFPIAIERLELSGGYVRYAERHREGDEPGEIEFTDLHGSLVNVSNEPARMSLATPAVLTVDGKVNDTADLHVSWNLPLLEPGPTMSYFGRIAPFSPSLLQSILTPLEGVAFPRGKFHALWFYVDATPQRATGSFHAYYTDVAIRLQNRVTGKQSFKDRLITFVANLILKDDNLDRPGKPAKSGVIDWEIPADAPFFKVFWVGIRTGLIDLFL